MLAAGADLIHFDVMDNHYVPNLTIGPLVCEALRKHGITAPIDVHLMVKPVDRIVPDFAEAGATWISFHPEASEHVDRTIGLIRDIGCRPGPGAEPGDAAELARSRAREDRPGAADVGEPGLRRPEVHPSRCCDKLAAVRERIARSGRDVRLEVDGGIKTDNIGRIAAAGADTFVAGSAIFGCEGLRRDRSAAMRKRID